MLRNVVPNYRGGERHAVLLERCRELRKATTDAESLVWQLLRDRQLAGVKFRRQHQFGSYILDFFASEHRLAVECDGGQHFEGSGLEADVQRDQYLKSRGIRVLRFSNTEVLQETEAVLMAILSTLEEPSP